MAVTLSAPAVDAAMAKQWGGGDRCPFASASSSLATIPADHPPIPLPTFEDHPVHVHTDDEVDDDTVHAHHHLPAADTIPSDPILYLPPLLSPLPAHLAHKHHDGPTEEELSSFDTHLPDIDPASLALHQALHHFAPVDNHYAARPYHTAFNWKAVGEHMDVDVEREWYCVVFRSRRNKGSESLDLYKADRGAHEEAVKNGGLILYWYGVPDSTGLNLATCIWQSRRHAVKAISGPKHLLAMKHAENAYEVYDLERWILRKEKGVKGLTLQKWQSGDVGW